MYFGAVGILEVLLGCLLEIVVVGLLVERGMRGVEIST